MSISFTIISFVFSIILLFVYFSKKRINYIENRIYSYIVIVTTLSCFVEIISFIQVQLGVLPNDIMYHLVMKSLFLCFLTWLCFFTIYTVITGRKLRGVLDSEIFSFKKISVPYLLAVLLIMCLPVNIKEGNGLLMPVGLSVTLIYVLATICIIIMIISMIKSYKYLKNKKYVPLYLLIVFFAIVVSVQNLFPELFIINTAFVITTFSMYFTIENPDMKMVSELIENRKIIERAGEEKSIFLFKMSQNLKEPINEIEKQIINYDKVKDNKDMVDYIIDNISENNKKIGYLINEVIGINSFNNNIKKVSSTYNIFSLLENIKLRCKTLPNNINYTFEIAKNMPKELYGDEIGLKQILLSLLQNKNNAKNSSIYIDVNSFTIRDICRLVITIEEPNNYLNIKNVNDILNEDLGITETDQLNIEKNNIDFALAYKMIKSLGGTMYIRSDDNRGIEIILTIDQYIVLNGEKGSSNVDSYIKARNNSKKILLVDDDEEETRRIKNILERRGYDVSISMYGQDAIDRIKDKEKYDVIIIDDEMSLMNGINVLYELNKLQNKSKKIVLLGKDKLFMAKHYLQDGFDKYIDKSNLNKEIKEKI